MNHLCPTFPLLPSRRSGRTGLFSCATMALIVLAGAASGGLGSFDIVEGGSPRSLFLCCKECVGVCFTEVSPGHVRLIEVRFVEDGSIQVCSTQISSAEICSHQFGAAEGGTASV